MVESKQQKEPKGRWSDCGQIFFEGSEGYGLKATLQTICLGNENDIKKFFSTGEISELPPSKLGGICGANSHTFFARIRFAAPKDAACHPTLRFIPAACCGVFSLAFIKSLILHKYRY